MDDPPVKQEALVGALLKKLVELQLSLVLFYQVLSINIVFWYIKT
jgi:hypothetical protein